MLTTYNATNTNTGIGIWYLVCKNEEGPRWGSLVRRSLPIYSVTPSAAFLLNPALWYGVTRFVSGIVTRFVAAGACGGGWDSSRSIS
jgi:hypothetical protein